MNNEITIDGVKYVRKFSSNLVNYSEDMAGALLHSAQSQLLSSFKEWSSTVLADDSRSIKVTLSNGRKVSFIGKDFKFEEFNNLK